MKTAWLSSLLVPLVVATGVFGQATQTPTPSERTFSTHNLEFSGGWVYTSGDNGLNGFNVGTSLWFTHRVSLTVNYDYAVDNTRLGVFELTSAGLTSVHSRLQNFMGGPRLFFPTKEVKRFTLDPFAEVQIGVSHLSTQLSQVNGFNQSASDTAFVWLLGGGVDYVVSHHWSARAEADLERTHFASAGQSRFRFVLGAAYTFGRRK